MNSIKTGLVVAVLLGVGYGVHVMLNKSTTTGQDQLHGTSQWNEPLDVQLGQAESGPPEINLGGTDDASFAGAGPLDSGDALRPGQSDKRSFDTVESPVAPQLKSATHDSIQSQPPPDPHSDQALSDEQADVAEDIARPSIYSTANLETGDEPAITSDSLDDLSLDTEAAVAKTETSTTVGSSSSFQDAWQSAQIQIEQNRLAEALFTLSLWYDNPNLSADDQRQLVELLDQLAGSVVFSTRHTLEPSYLVRGRETVFEISQQYNVPWQLLARINSIRDPQLLVPGQKLKVVRGPFRAEINLSRSELTMFLNRQYAGRFAVTIGDDPAPRPGNYEVLQKKYSEQDYFSADGRIVSAGDPANPYGKFWIGLSSSLSIHGSPTETSRFGNGCVSLSPRDAEDVFAILSRGSRIVITDTSGLSRRDASNTTHQ